MTTLRRWTDENGVQHDEIIPELLRPKHDDTHISLKLDCL